MSWADDVFVEQQEKQLALLDVPETLERHRGYLESLEDRLCDSQQSIERLQKAHEDSLKWQARLREYVLGGIVGAIISFILTFLLTSI